MVKWKQKQFKNIQIRLFDGDYISDSLMGEVQLDLNEIKINDDVVKTFKFPKVLFKFDHFFSIFIVYFVCY